jgi:hypothetical protein
MTSSTKPNNTYSVVWERPCGRFGFVGIEECASCEEAAEHFFDHVRGKDPKVPADAQISVVRLVATNTNEKNQ